MSKIADQLAAQLQLGTRLIWGEGSWARVSRCLDVPRVQLYRSEGEAREREHLGKRCCQDCRGVQHHFTEFIEPMRDAVPFEIGYRDKRATA
jgi:hypothetical protein